MATVVAPARGFTVVAHTYPQHVQHATSTPARIAPTIDHHKFLKGQPTALGTVQIMIGVVVLLFGVVTAFYPIDISTISGVMFWGAIIHIVAGGLTVGASKSPNLCLVRASLGMNIFSTITAGIAIIMYSIDFVIFSDFYYGCYRYYRDNYYYDNCKTNQALITTRVLGATGVMLVLSVLEFIVSICVSAFACKATSCCEQMRYMLIQPFSSTPMTYQAAASPYPQQVMYFPNQVPPSCPPLHLVPPSYPPLHQVPPSYPPLHLSATPLTTSEIPAFPPTQYPPAYNKC